MSMAPEFDALVFAGGGCRCFWQVGFLQSIASAVDVRPRQVAAVSAGAAMACMMFSGMVEEGLVYFERRVAANERNVYPGNLLRGAPVFPHEGIYRDTILHVCDERALARLRVGPEIRVLLARPPGGLGRAASVAVGFFTYEVEKFLFPGVHPRLAQRLGFSSEVVSLSSCETADAVAELILQSSCTPPFTPVYHRAGRPVLDGGLVDNVPVSALPEGTGNVLVLLTHPYPVEVLPRVHGRTYAQPSRAIPVDKWDYTSPDRVRATLDLGRRDGEVFLREWRAAAPSLAPA